MFRLVIRDSKAAAMPMRNRCDERIAMLFDCPECGLPATVTSRGRLRSTSGAVEHVDVHCVADHRFIGPADTLRVLVPR